jgi:hypothetical protein
MIAGSYNTGTVSGSIGNTGGILGEYDAGTLVGNYYLQGKATNGIGLPCRQYQCLCRCYDLNTVIGTWKPVTAGAATLNNGIYTYNTTGTYVDAYGNIPQCSGQRPRMQISLRGGQQHHTNQWRLSGYRSGRTDSPQPLKERIQTEM